MGVRFQSKVSYPVSVCFSVVSVFCFLARFQCQFQSGFIVPAAKPFQRSGFRVGFKVVLQIRFQGLVSKLSHGSGSGSGFHGVWNVVAKRSEASSKARWWLCLRFDFRIAVLRRWFSLLLNRVCKILTFLVYIFGSGCRTRSPPVCRVHVVMHYVALLVLKLSVWTSLKARHTLLVVLLFRPLPSASTKVR